MNAHWDKVIDAQGWEYHRLQVGDRTMLFSHSQVEVALHRAAAHADKPLKGEDDVVFDCPVCGRSLICENKPGEVRCSECNQRVIVPVLTHR